jgi:hypothetical protein
MTYSISSQASICKLRVYTRKYPWTSSCINPYVEERKTVVITKKAESHQMKKNCESRNYCKTLLIFQSGSNYSLFVVKLAGEPSLWVWGQAEAHFKWSSTTQSREVVYHPCYSILLNVIAHVMNFSHGFVRGGTDIMLMQPKLRNFIFWCIKILAKPVYQELWTDFPSPSPYEHGHAHNLTRLLIEYCH